MSDKPDQTQARRGFLKKAVAGGSVIPFAPTWALGATVTVATAAVATEGSASTTDTDADPSSGQVVVTGASGTHLRVTALSATSVQLELDANGDGTYESSGVFAWDSIGWTCPQVRPSLTPPRDSGET